MPVSVVETCFVDTNIWLYAFIERDDPAKSATAHSLLRTSQPVVSTQVINEVCVNLLRRDVFTEVQIQELVKSFYAKFEVVEFSQQVLLRAGKLRERHSFSFWDSLIVAAAVEASTNVLYSEDMQHGFVVDGNLKILNPFFREP
jgi:predicted nucleic acid-binding protein